MNLLDAARQVLADDPTPLHYRDICERVLAAGLWKTNGKTPWETVSARLAVDLKLGDGSYFVRPSPGHYTLNEDFDPNVRATRKKDRASMGVSSTVANAPQVGLLEAIRVVLSEAGEPLHYKAIMRQILRKGLWSSNSSRPWDAVTSVLSTELKRNGANSAFRRVGRGTYDLNSDYAEASGPTAEAGHHSFADAAELVLQAHKSRKPLHYTEITTQVLEQGLVQTKGATPAATLYAAVTQEVKRRRARAETQRFVIEGGGQVGLLEWQRAAHGLGDRIRAHNRQVEKRLRARMAAMDPYEFEETVGALLAAIGFEDVEVTKKGGDSGIDVRGTLVVADVVRTKMAVQVKRWKNNIHSPQVQQVRGSLGAHEQGLIITTSDFSSGARAEAERPDATPVALMSGRQLVSLLIEYEIGVERTPFQVYEISDERIADTPDAE